MTDIVIFITVLGGMVGIIASIIVGFTFILRKVSENAFDKGGHEVTHEALKIDVKTAHDKIRTIEFDIGALKTSSATTSAKIDSITEKIDEIKKGQDVILNHILERNR